MTKLQFLRLNKIERAIPVVIMQLRMAFLSTRVLDINPRNHSSHYIAFLDILESSSSILSTKEAMPIQAGMASIR